MPLRVLVATLALTIAVAPATAAATSVPSSPVAAGFGTASAPPPDDGGDRTPGGTSDDATRPTVNEFLPEDRGLGECISALPRPGCGSDARGGWRQGLILLAIVLGLGFITWRVVVSARRASRTRAATTPPADRVDDRAP